MSDLVEEYEDLIKHLPGWVKPLAIVKIFYGEGNPNNLLIHIRAIVDEDRVVYYYETRKGGIYYEIKSLYWIALCIEKGTATFQGEDKE